MQVHGPEPTPDPPTETAEDELDAMVIRHRIAHDNGNRTGLDEVLAAYGLTKADLEGLHPDVDDEPGEATQEASQDRREAFQREYEELTDCVRVEVAATAATYIREHWVLKVPANLWAERDTDPDPLLDWITEHYGHHGDCVDETNIGDETDRQLERIVGLYEPPAEPTPKDLAQRDAGLAGAIWSQVVSVGAGELDFEDRKRLEQGIRRSSVPEALADVVHAALGGRLQEAEEDA